MFLSLISRFLIRKRFSVPYSDQQVFNPGTFSVPYSDQQVFNPETF